MVFGQAHLPSPGLLLPARNGAKVHAGGKNMLEVWGGEFTNTGSHGVQILHRPRFASLDDLKRGHYLGDEEICPQPMLFLPPTPHQPHT